MEQQPEQIKKVMVRCPGCGGVLEVQYSRNEPVKKFACPICDKKLEVRFKSNDDYETVIRRDDDPVRTIPGKGPAYKSCYLQVGRQQYPLHEGVNTIGRKAESSTADTQLDDKEQYMSRSHIKINVSKLPDGIIRCVVTNDKNKNPTRINGRVMNQNDAIVLHEGDTIGMGNVIAIFRMQ